MIVDGRLFIRAYTGVISSWYKAALAQGAGHVHSGGVSYLMRCVKADPALADVIDDSYRVKYAGANPYLEMELHPRVREVTVEVIPTGIVQP